MTLFLYSKPSRSVYKDSSLLLACAGKCVLDILQVPKKVNTTPSKRFQEPNIPSPFLNYFKMKSFFFFIKPSISTLNALKNLGLISISLIPYPKTCVPKRPTISLIDLSFFQSESLNYGVWPSIISYGFSPFINFVIYTVCQMLLLSIVIGLGVTSLFAIANQVQSPVFKIENALEIFIYLCSFFGCMINLIAKVQQDSALFEKYDRKEYAVLDTMEKGQIFCYKT